MKTLLILSLCLFHAIFMSINGFGQNYEGAIDAILRAQLSTESPGGTALVVKDGKVLYKKAFGKADLELEVAMKPDHIFRIGSITKQFTASAILKLAEEGRLSLSDTITRFIKDYPMNGHAITIEHLLTHTSGVKNYTSLGKFNMEVRRKDFTSGELIDFFKNEPMDFPPGTDYRYSNSGYVLLGYIIELVSGKTYAEYIRENFFKPLGMEKSFYDNTSAIIPGRVSGYQRRNDHFENSDYLSMTLPYSSGSILSNIEDLFVWYDALMNNQVLNRESLEKAHTSYKLSDGRLTGYGYGWESGNVQGSPTIKHVGRINGFVTYCVYLPMEKIFVAIFSNCDCTDNLENPASRMAAIVLNKPYQWNAIGLTVKEFESYQAVYESAYEGQKIIGFEDGRLLYFSKGGSKTQLVPFEKDKFFIENSLTTLEFNRDSKGSIISFTSKSTGLSVTWNRATGEIKTLKSIKVSEQELEKFVGNYQFSNGSLFTIVKEGKKLYGQVGQDKKEILPHAKNEFFAKEIDAKIIFNFDKSGRVSSLTKVQSGKMNAKKIIRN
ncbi:MAG: serine hydrolase [Chitinophagaceae bacterium]|nr:serine hydrolase [Chitinophagaceae bacterium]MCW5929448.1 serine hydrolase [Chitinophagaceae bacterium]